MQIVPGQRVQLSYLVPNPSDVTVYFPQAVVKITSSGAVVATVNLTQDANQPIRYTGSFVAPADSVGNGYQMDSVCIPYTDSGHTTPSAMYGAALTEFFAYVLPSQYSGGGGETIIDYGTIASLLDDKFGAIHIPEMPDIEFPEYPEQKEVDLSPVMKALGEIVKTHAAITKEFESLNKRIDSLELKKLTPEEHAPILKAIGESKVSVHTKIESLRTSNEAVDSSISEWNESIKSLFTFVEKVVDEIKDIKAGGGLPIFFKLGEDKTPVSIPRGEMFKRLQTKK